ncbi:unnamed protein product [Symbiodinium necroappetens]|uniref:Uncharacterized protein n=1 Tax=Symbiodinium necroappetens TaxID=1628268 RepID=A0A812SLG4_9DINO|nr:unnamed protein product [Symbiodinium necroappetens]
MEVLSCTACPSDPSGPRLRGLRAPRASSNLRRAVNSDCTVTWGQRPRRWMQWPLAVMLLPEAAVGQAPGKACQCDFADNNWIHEITSMLQHVEDLPNALQNPEASSTKWILSQSCEEDASKFPNTDLAFDIQNQEIKCLTEHTAMSMVCAQQWIAKKSLMGVVKWVTRINELLQLVAGCMDAHSPIPFRADDFQTYLERFAGGVPPPQHPSFVQTLAWPTKASRKTASETKLPFLDCIPLKDPTCFPKHTSNPFESCSECCNRNRGPTGQVQCWQSGFDFARCCASEASEGGSEASSCPNPDATLQKSLEEERLKKEEISKQLARCQTDQEKAHAREQEAEKATDLAKTQAEAMKAETAKLKETAEAAAAEVEDLKKKLAEAGAKEKELTEEVKKLQAAASSAEDLKKLQAQLKEAEAKRQQETKKLQDQCNEQVAQTNKKKDVEIQKMQSELKEAGQAKQLQSDLQKIKTDLAKANEKSKQDASEIQKLRAELEKSKTEKGKGEAQGQGQGANKELEKLRSDVATASGKAKQDAASIQKLQNELVAHKQQCDTEKKKITGDGAKVAAECQTKSKATEAELQKLQVEIKKRQTEKELCSPLSRTSDELQKELKSLLGMGPGR